jgi:hypothetical protein
MTWIVVQLHVEPPVPILETSLKAAGQHPLPSTWHQEFAELPETLCAEAFRIEEDSDDRTRR